ncbi:MAG: MFS transporter, partial [Candidatus Nezhaarchaeales archaeon]
ILWVTLIYKLQNEYFQCVVERVSLTRSLVVLITGLSIVFMAYGIRYTFSMLLPEMMMELNLSNTQAGLIYTSFLTLYTITSVFIGFLVDVKGVKRVILMFLPFFGIGTSLMSLTFSYWSGALFFSIAGMGASVCWTPIVVWIQKVYQDKRGSFLGILQVGCNVGFGVLGIVIPLLLPYIGWRGCWALLGGILLCWTMPLVKLAYEPQVQEALGRSLLEQVKGFKVFLKDRRLWLGGLSYMLASFAIMIPMTFVKAYTFFELGMDPVAATALFSVIGFTGIVGALIIPTMSDKIGRSFSILLCNSIMVLGLIGSAIMRPLFIEAILWNTMAGISYGAVWPLYAALIKDLYDWSIIGSVTGLWTLMCGIGLLSSPLVGGLIIDAFNSYRPAYIVGGIMALVSTVLAFLTTSLRERK